jgi:hypothetical protein
MKEDVLFKQAKDEILLDANQRKVSDIKEALRNLTQASNALARAQKRVNDAVAKPIEDYMN